MNPQGHPPGILFLHGYACSSRDWSCVADLIREGNPVYAPDFPGHGQSRADRPVTFAELVRFTQALIEQRLRLPPVVVGHSMGGMVAVALAAQRPDLVSGIVLADAFPHLPTASAVLGGPTDPDDQFGFGSVMDADTPVEIQRRIRETMRRGVACAGTALFDSLLEVDLRPLLNAITTPSLLLLGDRRRITERDLPTILYRLGYDSLPKLAAELVHSHHFVMLEQPTRTASLIRSFIDFIDFIDRTACTRRLNKQDER
jgi:pimeloyl-ACP methyl ester carboxylesterase